MTIHTIFIVQTINIKHKHIAVKNIYGGMEI